MVIMPIVPQHCLSGNTPPNTRMQLTAFGARDRRFFDAFLRCAPCGN
jgi:hypothetical protein